MEPRFGHDFSDVRVHTDVHAAESAQAVGARAYTVGRHIVFAEGQYDTGSEQGQELLAHELTHTIQQFSFASPVPPEAPITIGSGETALERTAEESASRPVGDRRVPAVSPKSTLQRAPAAGTPVPQLNRRVVQLAQTAIEELDDGRSKKVLISTILAAAKLSELPAFAKILRATRDETFGDHFVFLFSEMEEDFGSSSTVSILQLFADAGVDITKLNYSLDPLAAVAKFKSVVKRFKALRESGDLSEADSRRVSVLIAEAEAALRAIEGDRRKPGTQVRQMGGVAAAAGVAWSAVGALAADDVTGIGVADDVAIPFVIIGAAALSAIALFTGGLKPQTLDYGPAKVKVEAALREMTVLLGLSVAMAANVADTGIMGEVHELIAAATAAGAALTVCAALAQLMAAAKLAGDSARVNKIKATEKAKGCRHSRHS